MLEPGFAFVMSAFSSPIAPDLFAAGVILIGVVGYIGRIASVAAAAGFAKDEYTPSTFAPQPATPRGFFAG